MNTTILFPSLKSPVQINTAKKKLAAIVAAGTAGLAMAVADVTKFTGWLAKPTLIEVSPADASGNQLVRMSAEGTAAIASAESTPAAPKAPKQVLEFKLETGFVPPVPNRSATRTSQYPFGSMEVGQSFFIPATEASPDPAKSLASTVSAATRRYATINKNADGSTITKAGRKEGSLVPVRTNTKEFTIRAVDETASGGGKGARIYRTA